VYEINKSCSHLADDLQVDAHDGHAVVQQLAQHGGRRRGGAQRGDDLGAAAEEREQEIKKMS
jgi:hypothetical protein